VPAIATFQIIDSISGSVVVGRQGYPTVPIDDTIFLEWELSAVPGGARIVTLEMETTAGTLESLRAYLAVDELAP
jgi:hypothetical protein